MPVKPRNTETITFSLPPETAKELRQWGYAIPVQSNMVKHRL